MLVNLFEHDSGINCPNTNPHPRRRRRRIRKPRKPRITAPPDAPLIQLQQHCVRCHQNTFAVGAGKAMHAASLLCSACGRFHGWASHSLVRTLGVAT
jgi:hypothetical protein